MKRLILVALLTYGIIAGVSSFAGDSVENINNKTSTIMQEIGL